MTTAVPSTINEPMPQWQGIDHLALITNDMDATVRFYHGVLGASVVGTVAAKGFRHYFFEFGPQCTVAFFEYADEAAHCEVTDVIDHGGVRSVYFTDPNGIALEASWWVNDPTGQGATDRAPACPSGRAARRHPERVRASAVERRAFSGRLAASVAPKRPEFVSRPNAR